MKIARPLVLVLFLLGSIALNSLEAAPRGVLFQYSTIQALMAGVYDGDLTYGELKQHGDFGLGTCNALDGEMIALDGKFYQVKADGVAYPVPDALKTPFADVTFFKPEKTVTVRGPFNHRELEKYLEKLLPSPNLIYALRIDGVFTYVKARSVPRQRQPYPPLAAAVKDQSIFEFHNVRGVIVGFWAPRYLAGINVTGYHLHFITADRRAGGHLLDCRLENARVAMGRLGDFHLKLPKTAAFSERDLTTDRRNEMGQVEK
jgi:acetolactate decarboxylase